jgi:subtilisin-like proprotein convertase family protein
MLKKQLLNQRILSGALFLLTIAVSAQDSKQKEQITKDYDQNKLTALYEQTKARYDVERQKAKAFAIKNDIPLKITNEDGSFSELMRVSESGHPYYYSLSNVAAARSTRANYLNTGGGLGLDLNGDGLTAHVWDGGATRPTHQEFDGAGGNNRVAINDGVSTLNGNSFHAQHVTGTIVASGQVQGNSKGMAWQADALTYDWSDDIPEAISSASSGMLVSNHSYGFIASSLADEAFGAYIQDSYDWDNLMYSAPYYLMVVAAGNDGNDNSSNALPLDGQSTYDKLSGHATSKNNLTVANGRDAVINGDGSLSSVTRNGSSSEGPTDDYRIKPDIMGNGTGVYSTYDSSDSAYNSITGTSMASPNVCGSLLLLQEHYNNLNGSFMRAATLKGLALHTADDVGAVGPDAQHGWGLMNTKFAAETISGNGLATWVSEEIIEQGETFTMTVQSDGVNPLMASISWTDQPGTVSNGTANVTTPVLVNDLDVRVSNGTTYSPWRLTAVNANGTGDNIVDPYERVDVNGASGSYTITVTHKGTLSGGPQRFSLVMTGLSSDFTIATTANSQSVCSDTDAVFNFNYNEIGNPAAANLSASNLPAGATAVFSPTSISADGSFTVTFGNLEVIPAGIHEITVTGDNGSESEDRIVYLTVSHSDWSPYPQSLSAPLDGALAQPRTLDLTWASNVNAEDYFVEVSDSPSFSTILYSGSETDTNFALSNLTSEAVYYWRVRPNNNCANGNWSDTFSFQVGSISCGNTYMASDTPIAISNTQDNSGTGMGNGWSISNIDVSDAYTIDSMTAYIDLTHTWLADLTLFLEAPDGTFITMIDGACTDLDDITATFTDAGTAIVCAGTPAISGNVLPDQALATFSGLPVNGNWQFYVNDPFNGDNGTINRFRLEVCSVAEVTNVPTFTNTGITVPPSTSYTILQSEMNGVATFAPVDIQYILLELPALGDIIYNGATTLAIGDTFTQQDVNTGLISYTNTHVCGGNAADQFRVDVFDSNSNGWIPNQTIPIAIDCLLSTDDFDITNISLWPNPSSGIVNVALNNTSAEKLTITVFDIQGRKVYRNNFDSISGQFETAVDLGNLSNGVYLFTVQQGNKSETRKLIMNK